MWFLRRDKNRKSETPRCSEEPSPSSLRSLLGLHEMYPPRSSEEVSSSSLGDKNLLGLQDKMDSPASPEEMSSSSVGGDALGFLRIRVKRGINLAIRDINSSDPYVVVKMAGQKLKTRVIKKDTNPEWNEDLNLSVLNPNDKVMLTVYDRDFPSKDDKMGDADFEIAVFMECLKMELSEFPNGTVIKRIQPNRQNCLVEESSVVLNGGRVFQDMCLRLRNVECGELKIQISCPIA